MYRSVNKDEKINHLICLYSTNRFSMSAAVDGQYIKQFTSLERKRT